MEYVLDPNHVGSTTPSGTTDTGSQVLSFDEWWSQIPYKGHITPGQAKQLYEQYVMMNSSKSGSTAGSSADSIPVSGSGVSSHTGEDSENYGSNDPSGFDQASWALEQQWLMDEAEREFNSAEAAKNREWQKEMSDTAIQRAVADIKAAGLNPWLALNGGSLGAASTPSGATASSSSGSSKVPQNYLYKLMATLVSSATSILKLLG